MGIRSLAALRHRDFSLFWVGLTLSLIGSWMQQIAGPWLVFRLTDSALALGLVGLIAAIPAAPLSLVAGPLIDRLPRRPVLLACQLGLLLPPLGLAVLTWLGKVQVWHVVLAEVLRGVVATLDQPAKQVAVVDMTGVEDAASGVALWMVAINIAKVVGPAIAGVIVARWGEALCFLLNGLSYLAVIGVLLVIRLPGAAQAAHQAAGRSLAGSLVDGLRYVLSKRLLVAVAGLVLVAGFFVRPFQTLLPVLAEDVLAGGPRALGFLTAAAGAGALLGALGAAGLPPGRRRVGVAATGLLLPLVFAGVAFSRSFVLSCGLLLVVGGLLAGVETLGDALLLTGVRAEFRGRVMSLFTAATMGAPRLGGLAAGWLASSPLRFGMLGQTVMGVPLALGAGAVGALLCTVPLVGALAVANAREAASQMPGEPGIETPL